MQTHTTNTDSKTIDHLNSFLRGELSAVESYRLAAPKRLVAQLDVTA